HKCNRLPSCDKPIPLEGKRARVARLTFLFLQIISQHCEEVFTATIPGWAEESSPYLYMFSTKVANVAFGISHSSPGSPRTVNTRCVPFISLKIAIINKVFFHSSFSLIKP